MSGKTETRDHSDRTDLAEDRTLLAHERSFAGWIRTGLTCIGIGLGFNALFSSMEPLWIPKAIASAFLLIAAYIFVSSARRASSIRERLNSHSISTLKTMQIWTLAILLIAATVALLAAIWMLV